MEFINKLFRTEFEDIERFLIYIHTEDSRSHYERLAAVKIMKYYESHFID